MNATLIPSDVTTIWPATGKGVAIWVGTGVGVKVGAGVAVGGGASATVGVGVAVGAAEEVVVLDPHPARMIAPPIASPWIA